MDVKGHQLILPSSDSTVTTVYLIDAGLCIEEEQLYCGIVLKVRDTFYVEPVEEKITCTSHYG